MSRWYLISALVLFPLTCGSVTDAQDTAPRSRLAAKFLIQDNTDRPALEPIADQVQTDGDQESVLAGEQGSQGKSPSWRLKWIREITLDVRDKAERIPDDRSVELAGYGRQGKLPASDKVFAWAAPNIRYQPLYFEDVTLERYGQTLPRYRQTVASNLHFWRSFIALPRQMLTDPPASCDYPLGFCRPGDTVPFSSSRRFFK